MGDREIKVGDTAYIDTQREKIQMSHISVWADIAYEFEDISHWHGIAFLSKENTTRHICVGMGYHRIHVIIYDVRDYDCSTIFYSIKISVKQSQIILQVYHTK